MNIKQLFFTGFAFLLFNEAGAQNLPFDTSVRTGKLANGFTYYIRHNEEPKKRVVMYLVNKAGSVLEDEDQRGLAHFMEHMSFNGTKNFPHNELVNYLQKSGVRFGADINAYTNFDETVYQLPLPTDNPDILKNGIQIMRDWAQNATLDPVEIDKERGVVLEEKRLGKGAGERMQRVYWPILLNNSRYATRIPIGLDTVLNNFKRPAIARFYHDWYRPDLQALIIVGDINADSMVKVVRSVFGDLKNPVHERVRTQYSVPLSGKNEFVAVTDKEMTSTVAQVMIKQKGLSLQNTGDYRNHIIRDLSNQMLGERYSELSRQADSPFLNGGASMSSFIGGLDIFNVSVTAKPGELERGFKAVWRETERVKRFGFTQTELDRTKQSYLTGITNLLKEKNKIPSDSYVKEYQAYFLRGIASPGIDYEYNLVKNDLSGITLTELNTLFKTEIKPVDRDILILAPEKDKSSLPNETVFNSWMNAIEQEKLLPYKDEVSKEPLLSLQPKSGKIIKEQYDAKLDISTITLSNGIKVLLKKTNFKNDEISFNGFAPGGTSLYSDADFQSASAANIIPSFGAGNYNTTELSKYLSGKQLTVSFTVGERTQNIRGAAVNQDLETAMQLVYAYFTAPRKDSVVFRGMIDRSKASMVNRMNDPGSAFSDTVSAVMGNHNIRRTGPTLEKINQIDLDKAYTIFKERFADASGFTFVFVGSINTAAIKPLLEKYLGSLPDLRYNEKAKDLHIHIPEGKIERTIYKGSEPKASVRLVFSGDFNYNLESTTNLDALKEVLEIRLLERLREDESGVYSPGVSAGAIKYPYGRYSFVVQFGCAPQNVEKLIASTLDEISKLKTDGTPLVNIDKYKAEDARSEETRQKTNSWWLGYISEQLENQDDLYEFQRFGAVQKKITPESLKEAANLYLSGKNYIQFILLPEKN